MLKTINYSAICKILWWWIEFCTHSVRRRIVPFPQCMTIGEHVETLTFAITNTGSSNIILGFSWLKFHNPLVNWRTAMLCFNDCPTACTHGTMAPAYPQRCTVSDGSAVDHGPDAEFIHRLSESSYGPDDSGKPLTVEEEWSEFLAAELQTDNESLLCVDLNELDNDTTMVHEHNQPTDNSVPATAMWSDEWTWAICQAAKSFWGYRTSLPPILAGNIIFWLRER